MREIGNRDEDLESIDAEFLRELAASRVLAGEDDNGLIRAAVESGVLSPERMAFLRESRDRDRDLPPILGPYRIIRRLSAGGMGEVLLAHDPDGHEVAVKVLPLDHEPDDEMRARFARELRAMSMVDHPHVVRHLASGSDPAGTYLAMERVHGPTLQWYLDNCGGMSEQDAWELARQLAEALAECWRKGLVHRDVKPDNVLLDTPRPGRTESFCAKLCDFGLAIFLNLGPREFHTDPEQAIGTPAYMSPEQIRGLGQADPRHDIYSLGLTISTAILGICPFEGGSTRHIVMQKLEQRPDLEALSRHIGPAFHALIRAMIAPCAERIADWSQVLDSLAAIGRPAAAPAQQRKRGSTVGIVIALVAGLALLGGFLTF